MERGNFVEKQVTYLMDDSHITRNLPMQIYAQEMLCRLQSIYTPWVMWTASLGKWTMSSETDVLSHMSPSDCCLVAGPRKLAHVNLLEYFCSNFAVPLLWRTVKLQEYFRAIKNLPPCPRFLPYAIALQLPEDYFEFTDTRLPQIRQRETIFPKLTQGELTSVLPILRKRTNSLKQNIPSNPPSVSVVICAYNETERIDWAIQSVLAQSYEDWELIVVDDGSTDDTTEQARAHSDFRIRVIRIEKNQGKAFALNYALGIARGKYFMELDADDWLSVNALEVLYNEMDGLSQEIAMLTGYYHVWFRRKYGDLLYKGVYREAGCTITQTEAQPPIPRFYKTDALRTIGGWPVNDPSKGRLFEDIAICYRLLQRSRMHVIPQAVYNRVIRTSSVSQQHNH